MNQITTQPQKAKPARKPMQTPQQVFQRRWQEIEKAQKSLDKAQKDQQVLVDKFNTDLLPFEQEICQQQYQFINTLLNFSAKKSLSERQRETICDWIDEIFTSLTSSPFRVDIDIDALEVNLRQATLSQCPPSAEELDLLREELYSNAGENLNLTNEELLAILANPELLAEKIALLDKDPQAADESVSSDEENEEFFHFEDFFDNLFNGSTKEPFKGSANATAIEKNELFLSEGVLNRCYKKLANRFHPDKAKPEDLAESHELMVELSKAKKNNDAFSIFMLYQQHIKDDDFMFSDNELNHINVLLSKKLREIESAKAELKFSNEMDSLICRRFKGRSKRATENNFADHLDEMQQRLAIYQDYSQITNLKILKAHLADRRERIFW